MGYCATSSVIKNLCQKSCGQCAATTTALPGSDSSRETIVVTSIRPTTTTTSSTTSSSTAGATASSVHLQLKSECEDDLPTICKKWANSQICNKGTVSKVRAYCCITRSYRFYRKGNFCKVT